jgi:hypothetical protein
MSELFILHTILPSYHQYRLTSKLNDPAKHRRKYLHRFGICRITDAGKEFIPAESAISGILKPACSIAPKRVLDLRGEVPALDAVTGVRRQVGMKQN